MAAGAPDGAAGAPLPGRPVATVTPAPPSSYRGAAATATGVVVPVVGGSEGAWLVGTPCGQTATVRTIRPLTGAVVLDAGHGGKETGAIGPLGTWESHLNQAVADHARTALEAAGIPVV